MVKVKSFIGKALLRSHIFSDYPIARVLACFNEPALHSEKYTSAILTAEPHWVVTSQNHSPVESRLTVGRTRNLL